MPTKQINIMGTAFEISAPYAEGHQITAAEAKSLNQTRAENIANNFRKQVKEAGDDAAKLAAIATALADYDAKYDFSVRAASPRTPVDPVEKECYELARGAIKAALASEGRKLKEIEPDKLEAAIEGLAVREDIVKLAKKRVADRQKGTAISLSDLGLVTG